VPDVVIGSPDLPGIEKIYIYLSRGADGKEGVCAMKTDMGWMPLVVATRELAEELRPYAERLAMLPNIDGTISQIVMAEFTSRTDLEVIG
jgi:hypothetical protein